MAHHDIKNNKKPDNCELLVNANPAEYADFPQYAKSASDFFIWGYFSLCGATLINSDYLLTAAHCQGAFNNGLYMYNITTGDFFCCIYPDCQLRFKDYNLDNMQIKHDITIVQSNL